MTAYDTIKSSFKALFLTTPLKSITVEDICRDAYVSRKTFYMYFSNKFDVIDKIFQDDIMNTMQKLRELLPMSNRKSALIVLEHFYQNLHNNRDFYCRLIRGKGQHWFRERMITRIEEMNRKLSQRYLGTLSSEEISYMSYFFAAAQAMFIIRWLENGCQLSPLQMAEYYDKWAISYWYTLGRVEDDHLLSESEDHGPASQMKSRSVPT
jgi:AcrR family transcriptional regulator